MEIELQRCAITHGFSNAQLCKNRPVILPLLLPIAFCRLDKPRKASAFPQSTARQAQSLPPDEIMEAQSRAEGLQSRDAIMYLDSPAFGFSSQLVH
jgi:hypothetical protein